MISGMAGTVPGMGSAPSLAARVFAFDPFFDLVLLPLVVAAGGWTIYKAVR